MKSIYFLILLTFSATFTVIGCATSPETTNLPNAAQMSDNPTNVDSNFVPHTKSCGVAPHGSVATGYNFPTAPQGFTCTPVTKTCLDGQWVPANLFDTCMESPSL